MEQGNYRLTLEKVGTDDDGDRVWENVIEVTDTPDGIVNAWLPTVSMRLGGALGPMDPLPSIQDVDAQASPLATLNPGESVIRVPAPEAPKRKRRTKAEIAADEQAQAAGFRDAAHQAEMVAALQPREVTISTPAPVAPPAATFENGPQAFPSTPAEPFNPFAAMQANTNG